MNLIFRCVDVMGDDLDKIINTCRSALLREPLSEPLYRRIIEAHLQNGNRDMAHAVLNQCRSVLQRYLDSDASIETLALIEQ